jgi:tetratricopeptide (TPR) repeat protein
VPEAEAELPGPVSEEFCAECIGRSLLSMKESLIANDRKNEGRQVYFKAALAFSAREAYLTAADLARSAFEFSERNEDRAASLIQEGLCRLNTGELQKADEALVLASQYSADQALVAFYRGQVQFAWRDYIEALDRFGEALETGSEQVPAGNICFQMALCHINIEEYSDARRYLARCPMSGQEAVPVSFYRGICELGEGRAESAMAHFLEALAMGPSREDLGRVLFNIGTCLKELGRLDEAIDVLRKAVEVDPEDLANHNLLGFCYYRTKRHQQAVACFRRAVEIEPNSAIDWANLASNLRDMGEIEEAMAMYEKALSLDPTIGFARVNLAKLTKMLKDRST